MNLATDRGLGGALPRLTLTSEPPSLMESTICHGSALLTCNAMGIPFVFLWVLNNTPIAEYSFDLNHSYPQNLSVRAFVDFPSLVQVTNAYLISTGIVNLTSTWSVPDVSVISGLSIHCEDSIQTKSNLVIVNDVQGKS